MNSVTDQPVAVSLTRPARIRLEFKNRCRELLDLLCEDGTATGGQIGPLRRGETRGCWLARNVMLVLRTMTAPRPVFPGRFIFNSRVGHVASQLMQSDNVRLYHDQALFKEPGGGHTPWHQDQPYYNVDGLQNISFWIPVDPVSRPSTLEFIAGSHRGPWLMPRTFMTNQAKWFPEGSLAELPDIDKHREDFPILGWELQPGDLVCFHMLSLHASAGVDGTQRRRVYSVRFLGDDMTHAPRPWVTSPPFPGLDQELPAGVPMDHALFPLMPGL